MANQRLFVAPLLALLMAAPIIAQTPPPVAQGWSGWAQCQITIQATGYSHRETHLWTVTGAGTRNGNMEIYPTSWTVTGDGSLQRVNGPTMVSAQWTVNGALQNVTIGTTLHLDRITVQRWTNHGPARSGLTGTEVTTINGVGRSRNVVLDVQQWAFPAIATGTASTRATGSNSVPFNGLRGPLNPPSGAMGTAACTWDFARGASTPASPPAVATPTTPTSGGAVSSGAPGAGVPAGGGTGTTSTTPAGSPSAGGGGSGGSGTGGAVAGGGGTGGATGTGSPGATTAGGGVGRGNAGGTGAGGGNSGGTALPILSSSSPGGAPSSGGGAGTGGAGAGSGAGGGSVNFRAFTTSGAFVVPVGVTTIGVELWGAGGGGAAGANAFRGAFSGPNGGAGGGGGGSGAFLRTTLTVTPGGSYNVVIGAGGNAGGGNGGNSEVMQGSTVLASAAGGSGGTGPAGGAGGMSMPGASIIARNGLNGSNAGALPPQAGNCSGGPPCQVSQGGAPGGAGGGSINGSVAPVGTTGGAGGNGGAASMFFITTSQSQNSFGTGGTGTPGAPGYVLITW